MRSSLITRGSWDDSEFVGAYADVAQPRWSRSGYPASSSDDSPTTQPRDLIIAGIASGTGLTDAVMVHCNTESANKSLFVKLLEEVEQHRRDSATSLTTMPVQKSKTEIVEQHRRDSATSLILSGLFLTVNSMTAFDRIVSESATSWEKVLEYPLGTVFLKDMIQKMFFDARDEIFEDGMSSFFSASLIRIVQDHGVAAVRALEEIISASDVNTEVAEEALRQIGYMDDKRTYQHRLSLLVRALESPNARIRDAASIGIEAMDDPATIESLQRAIDREQHEQLRQNFKDVLAQLQDGR